MVSNSLTKKDVTERAQSLDFPSSVVEFFQGYLGQPVGGFPEPLRTHIIRDKPRIDGRPGATLEPLDLKKIKADLRTRFGKHITDADVSSYAMYPKVFEEYQAIFEKYGDLRSVESRCRSGGHTDMYASAASCLLASSWRSLRSARKCTSRSKRERPSLFACSLSAVLTRLAECAMCGSRSTAR